MPTNPHIFGEDVSSPETSRPRGAQLRAAAAKAQVPIELVLSSDARVPLSGEIPLSAKIPLQFLLSIRKGDTSSMGPDVAVVEDDEDEDSDFEETHAHAGRRTPESWLVVRPVKPSEPVKRARSPLQTPRSPLWQYLTRDQELKERGMETGFQIEKRQVALEGSFAALEEEVDRLRQNLDEIITKPSAKLLTNATCSILHDVSLIQVQVQDMHEVSASTVLSKLQGLRVVITRVAEKIDKWGPHAAEDWLDRAVELSPFDIWEKEPDIAYREALHAELNRRIACLHQVAALVVAHNPQGEGVRDWPPPTPGSTKSPAAHQETALGPVTKGTTDKKSK